ncbi:hypothetical protein DdX_19338 [Ditylenchus destructor]|uniref:F-box domain-containing protein n=1 Tax=Ditylenchus destructor TaxID=166010 RepID=A0AAD4QU95_9BILA|nr:hypothetical protein DdX_19338 [Ditylenchus destructor]
MRRSARLAEKEAKVENKAEMEPKGKKMRSKDTTTKIATLDNGTIVEVFKYLNYAQLAKNSLVSKRFCHLIRTHRNSLAFLYVDYIDMYSIEIAFPIVPAAIKIFDKQLSAEAYNEWVIRNSYSKQAPIENQTASTQSNPNGYQLSVFAHYKDPNNGEVRDRTAALFACLELNHENWPVFQHFIRLITDPFIYIDCMTLPSQNDVFNLLAGSVTSDQDRLQCKKLSFNMKGNSQKFINWTKNHVRCNEFCITGGADLNQDESFLDFFFTGAQCTSEVKVKFYDLSRVIADFVQNFLDIKNRDECQCVQSIESYKFAQDHDIQVLKKDLAKFIVKEGRVENDDCTEYVFEFINNAIEEKLQLTANIFDDEDNYWYSGSPSFLLEIKHL